MTNDEVIQRANRAAQLLADPLLIEAFDGLESGAVERIAACDALDIKRLQTLTLALQTTRAIRHRFNTWVAEGEDAARRQMRKDEAPTGLLSRFRRAA